MIKGLIYQIIDIILPHLSKRMSFASSEIKLPYRVRNYFHVNYESSTMHFLKFFPYNEDAIIDIGAHVGLYTSIFSKLTKGHALVYSIEPSPSNFKILKKTIKVNSLKNVIPLNNAISNKSGMHNFYLSDDVGYNANSFIKKNTDPNRNIKKVLIKSYSIDDLGKEKLIKNCQILKIDVEGFEFHVLEGSVEFIRKHNPVIILALHPNSIHANGDSLNDIWEFFNNLNYLIQLNGEIIKKKVFTTKNDLFDVIAFPKLNSLLKKY